MKQKQKPKFGQSAVAEMLRKQQVSKLMADESVWDGDELPPLPSRRLEDVNPELYAEICRRVNSSKSKGL